VAGEIHLAHRDLDSARTMTAIPVRGAGGSRIGGNLANLTAQRWEGYQWGEGKEESPSKRDRSLGSSATRAMVFFGGGWPLGG
jgi:hypothetical protein